MTVSLLLIVLVVVLARKHLGLLLIAALVVVTGTGALTLFLAAVRGLAGVQVHTPWSP